MIIPILVVASKNSSTDLGTGLIVRKSQHRSNSSDALAAVYIYCHQTIHTHSRVANSSWLTLRCWNASLPLLSSNNTQVFSCCKIKLVETQMVKCLSITRKLRICFF